MNLASTFISVLVVIMLIFVVQYLRMSFRYPDRGGLTQILFSFSILSKLMVFLLVTHISRTLKLSWSYWPQAQITTLSTKNKICTYVGRLVTESGDPSQLSTSKPFKSPAVRDLTNNLPSSVVLGLLWTNCAPMYTLCICVDKSNCRKQIKDLRCSFRYNLKFKMKVALISLYS